jgi:copper homeostasis protein (lipoprotein)
MLLTAAALAACAVKPQPAAEADDLAGTSWRFVELYGAPVQLPAITGTRQPLLVFNGRGRVFGSDGCSRVLGSYTITRDRIAMNGMAGTQMACLNTGSAARHFREALTATQRWHLDGGLLALYGAGGQTLAILERQPRRTL